MWRQPRLGKVLFVLFISQSRGNREWDPDKHQVPRNGCREIQVKHLQTACGSAHQPRGAG